MDHAAFVDALRRLRLLEPDQLAELDAVARRHAEPRALAKELIDRGWLSPYQVNLLFQGRGQELQLGPYILLERLGEGGMGQVFKARHGRLGRIVAVKVIRKERLTNPGAVRRFHREVRVAAQLDHPNVVHAHDADQVGDTHFFVMEYVEGIDLGKLLKQQGPLPVEQACDYIRQAALGLQHAYERGLVHRDIKPANLLVARGAGSQLVGPVKILDMGLARVLESETDDDAPSTLTQEGAVMGTLDYIAPEQARNSHSVDIRADLYSLGCTLFHLLTGRAPFPGGTAMEKLMRHQAEPPPAVEQLRPGVPPAVRAVLARLLAKRPEDRYQTPAEAAVALGDALAGRAPAPVSTPVASLPAEEDIFADLTPIPASGPSVSSVRLRQSAADQHQRLVWLNLAGGGVLALLLGVFLFLLLRSSPTPRAATTPTSRAKPAAAPSLESWLQETARLPADKQVEAVTRKLQDLNPGFDGDVTAVQENNLVTGLTLATDEVSDLAPVRALPWLRTLKCRGSGTGRGRLTDLAPLKDLPLIKLDCGANPITDLAPLKGMVLTDLILDGTNLATLAPLSGMPLANLNCTSTPIADLAPLKGMPLGSLHCARTRVRDLSPLQDLPLTSLNLQDTPVEDLAPLSKLPLRHLVLTGTAVADLAPLSELKLTSLSCDRTQVTDLAPLRNVPLEHLRCDFKPERDAAVLRKIKTLQTINGRPTREALKKGAAVVD